jgi:hypothetical protein
VTDWKATFKTAEEAAAASRSLVSDGHYPQGAFFACHAFEMAGVAFVQSLGEQPSGSHAGRVNQFAATARRYLFGHGVALVAAQVASARNRSLYPREDVDGQWRAPSHAMRRAEAARLQSRVEGILRVVRREFPQ